MSDPVSSPSLSVSRFKELTKLNKVLMDQKISPLQLFSFVCRVLKAYEVCPREEKFSRCGDIMNGWIS